MKTDSFSNYKSNDMKDIKHKVVKGSENMPYDANMMAQIEQEKTRQEEMEKKQKMDSFLNSTRINASKLCKQKTNLNNQKNQSKKEFLEKQKDLKSKYTIVKKPIDRTVTGKSQKNIPKPTPVKVEWKKADNPENRVQIADEKLQYQDDSDGQMSAIDSDIDCEKESTPKDMLSLRQNIRFAMCNKYK